jgi:hypothetical protein
MLQDGGCPQAQTGRRRPRLAPEASDPVAQRALRPAAGLQQRGVRVPAHRRRRIGHVVVEVGQEEALAVGPALLARRWRPSVRSHCCFGLPLIHFIPDFRRDSVSCF